MMKIEQGELFGIPVQFITTETHDAKPVQPQQPQENPCIARYGEGPAEKRCKDCVQLLGICKAKTYYKCRLRQNTNGAKTDHKLRWQTCGKFEQRVEDIPLYDGRS